MIIETEFEQGTPEWHSARLGSIGGTCISQIITTTGQPSKSREGLLLQKAHEIITGKPCKPSFKTFEMQWGNDHEPEARELFSFIKGVEVDQCAIIWNDEHKRSHVSPDGLVTELKNGLEIKCYQLKHFKEVKDVKTIPTENILQVQKSLAVTGWDIWWLMFYFPGLQPNIIPVERDESLIKLIKVEEILFFEDLEKLIKELKGE